MKAEEIIMLIFVMAITIITPIMMYHAEEDKKIK